MVSKKCILVVIGCYLSFHVFQRNFLLPKQSVCKIFDTFCRYACTETTCYLDFKQYPINRQNTLKIFSFALFRLYQGLFICSLTLPHYDPSSYPPLHSPPCDKKPSWKMRIFLPRTWKTKVRVSRNFHLQLLVLQPKKINKKC